MRNKVFNSIFVAFITLAVFVGGGLIYAVINRPSKSSSIDGSEFDGKYTRYYENWQYTASEESETTPIENLFWSSHRNGNSNPEAQVSTAAELADVLWGGSGNLETIELTDNIDMSGYLWKTIDVSGLTIIGNGFEIFNVTVLFDYTFLISTAEENNMDENALYEYFSNDCPYYNGVGMFGLMENCAVSDLKVSGDVLVARNSDMSSIAEKYGFDLTSWFPETWYVGGLAGQAISTSFVNVGSEFNIYFNLQDAENKICYVGGLVGSNTGYGYVNFGESTIGYVGPDYAEIPGEEDGYAIRGCYSRSYIISEANVSSDSCCGGIFGYFDANDGGATSGLHLCYSRIYIALSNGQWSNVGGMLGKTNVTTIWYCYSVYYDISGGKNVGGIVGYLTGEIGLDQSIFNSFTEASFVQGRFGSLKTQLSGQGYVGAFVGHTDGQTLYFKSEDNDDTMSLFRIGELYEISNEEYPAVGDDYGTYQWHRQMEDGLYSSIDWTTSYKAEQLGAWQDFYSQSVGGGNFGKEESLNCWIMGGKYWYSNPMSAGGAIAGDFGYPCLKWESTRARCKIEFYDNENAICSRYGGSSEYYSVRRFNNLFEPTLNDVYEYETSGDGSYFAYNDTDAWMIVNSGNASLSQFFNVYFSDGIIVDDIVFYLESEGKSSISVTFDGNGGTYKSKTEYVLNISKGDSISSPPAFELDENSYIYGWSTSRSEYVEANLINIQSDMTVYAWWKDYYIVTYDANGGNISGSVTSQKVKENGKFTTLSAIKSGYKFRCWSTDPTEVMGSYTGKNTTYTFTANKSITLYAIWTVDNDFVLHYNLYVDEDGTGIYKMSYDLIKLALEKWTISYYHDVNGIPTPTTEEKSPYPTGFLYGLVGRTFTFTFYPNSEYQFVNYTMTNSSISGDITSSSSVYPTSTMQTSTFSYIPSSKKDNSYLYVFIKKQTSSNSIKYDSKEKYFYFEDGYFPQSYVGDSLNATLNSASSGSLSLYQNLKYLDGDGVTQTIPIYTYSGNKYAKVIKGSTTKWFKVEAIRWRVGEYGVSATDYPGIWENATGATNFMTVSDKILWVGAITTEKTTEGWKFSDSDMAKNFAEIYTKNGATLTDDAPKYAASSSEKSYYFGEAGQQEKVKHTTETVSSINIATVEDINNSAITDLRARASDMVAFILGIDDDSYCNYWTRQLGVSLNNGISVINGGIQKSAWLKNCYGVRFSLRMTEGART